MHKIKSILVVAAIVLATGCAATQVQLNSRFDAVEAKKLMEKGGNTIVGSAFLRQRDGDLVTCSGFVVQLVPVTAYATERALAYFGTTVRAFAPDEGIFNKNMPPRPADYDRYSKTTTCDVSGKFKFTDLADGSYFITTTITWMAGEYSRQGGTLLQRVYVDGNEPVEIVMSQ